MHLRLLQSDQSHSSAIYGMCKAFMDDHFFSCSADQYIALWKSRPLAQQSLAIKLEHAVYACTYIPDYHYLIAGLSNGDFHVIDTEGKKELRHIQHHHQGIYDFAFDRSDHQLIVAGGDGQLSVWSLPIFKLIRSIPLCQKESDRLRFHPIKVC